MPRKPNIRPRAAIRSLDRAKPNVLKAFLYHPSSDAKVELELIGAEDGSFTIWLYGASSPLSKRSEGDIKVQVKPPGAE